MPYAVCSTLYAAYRACYFEGAVRGAHVEGVRGDVCGMLCCMLYAVYCMLFEGAVRGAHVGKRFEVVGTRSELPSKSPPRLSV